MLLDWSRKYLTIILHVEHHTDSSSLVDDITYRKVAASHDATASAILGPFWRHDRPLREFGSTCTFNTPPDGQVAYFHGTVTNAKTGKPLAGAEVEMWQASTNGM